MPTVSMFFGIKIQMYADDHNPPHFHATYQGHEAVYDLDGNQLRGAMPHRQDKMISVWAMLRADELREEWRRGASGDNPQPIEPLR